MKRATANVRIVTPCLLAGTDQTTAELRPASIRGQLRWWFRLLNPGRKEQEKAIFGGVNNGTQASSLVTRIKTPAEKIRVVDKQNAEQIAGSSYDYFLWPLGRRNSTPRGVIAPGETFELLLTHRHVKDGDVLPKDVLEAFLLFGALGTRSRRAYGGIFPKALTIDGKDYNPPPDIAAVAETAERLLKPADCRVLQIAAPSATADESIQVCVRFLRAFRCGSDKSGTPSKWGENDHDAPFSQHSAVYRPALGLPLKQRYSRNRGSFDTEVRQADSRWASPLLLKVVPVENGFLPLAIFCNSMVLREQPVTLRDRNKTVKKDLSHDLWHAMQDPSRHPEVGWKGAKLLTG